MCIGDATNLRLRFNTEPRVDRPTDRADPDGEFGVIAEAAEELRNAFESTQPDNTDVALLQHALPSDVELRKCLALASALDQTFLDILYLWIFCTDFAVLNAFHQHEDLQDKRDLHHGMWARLMTDEQSQQYSQRFSEYSEAMVSIQEGQSVAEALGRKFAAIHANDDIRVCLAIAQFAHTVILEDVEAIRNLAQSQSS